ncbi:hypothetical protein [Halosegnis longus]|uniref:Uncharacterized protein n=1 Tax=Halosegnis longus TaxID=2216012 RepID=A0AAJ4UVC9_9EURY|nr:MULTISPECIES: hypothetical protein [Halobacteriales]RNJ25853.1 hypothetical protein Nmn1133_03555 [Salella cibi]
MSDDEPPLRKTDRAIPPQSTAIARRLTTGDRKLCHCLDCGRQLVAIKHGDNCLFCGSRALVIE